MYELAEIFAFKVYNPEQNMLHGVHITQQNNNIMNLNSFMHCTNKLLFYHDVVI